MRSADKLLPDAHSEPYAHFVGSRYNYKNFATLLHALGETAWPPQLRLHVVGAPLRDCEWNLLDFLGVRGKVRDLGRLTTEKLMSEYSSASCFMFPSLMEGFGLPVLGAQVIGCPAVVSDIPVFREVAGEGALFFDPRRAEALAEAVATTCDPAVRRRLVESGLDNVRRFNWDRTADQTRAVYEEAVQSAGRVGAA